MSAKSDSNSGVDLDHMNCNECGGSYRPEEIFMALPHGREYACRGCVAQYLANDEWPYSD